MNSMIDTLLMIAGAYIIYLCVEMKVTGKVKANALLPKNLKPEHCKDPAGYIAFIFPRQIVFGILAVVGGFIGCLQDTSQIVWTIAYLIVMVIFLVCAVFYAKAMKKAVKEFWH